MKRFASRITVVAGVLLATSAVAQGKVVPHDDKSWDVTVDKLPTTLEECTALRDELNTTPQGAMVYYLVAQLVMIDKGDLGEQCLVLGLDMERLEETIKLKKEYKRVNVKGYQLGTSEVKKAKTSGFVADQAYAAKSWVIGTDPKDGYKLPDPPYKYFVRTHNFQNLLEKGIWKGFVNTSGNATAAAPFHVKKNDKGIYKMYESSSFYAGTEDPPKQVKDDL